MQYKFRTKNVCSSLITFEVDDGIVKNIEFQGGCNGNLKAISKLCNGMRAEEIIEKLEGNRCGFRDTSCADQFAKALKEAVKESE